MCSCLLSGGHPSNSVAAKRTCGRLSSLQGDEKGEEQLGRRWTGFAGAFSLACRLKDGRGFLFNLITPSPRCFTRESSEAFSCPRGRPSEGAGRSRSEQVGAGERWGRCAVPFRARTLLASLPASLASLAPWHVT